MKKFLILSYIITFLILPVFSAGNNIDAENTEQNDIKNITTEKTKNKKTSTKNEVIKDTKKLDKQKKNSIDDSTKGYDGALPDISDHFKMYQEQEIEPTFEIDEDFNDPYKVKPAPRDNPSFINIILKQDKSSQFVNDINELIFIIEKIEQTLESNANLQVFIARAYNLDKYIEFFRNKYENKPESSYVSYKQIMQLNSEVQALAALRREKEVYSPYVVSDSNGNAFSDNNIDLQTEYLLENIKSTLILMKEVK